MRRITRLNQSRRSRYNKPESNYVFSVLGAGTMAIVGFLMSAPFWWHIFFGKPSPVMSLWDILSVIMFVIGGPLFLWGLIGFFTKKNTRYNSIESDLARIRFAAETHMMNDVMDKMKGK